MKSQPFRLILDYEAGLPDTPAQKLYIKITDTALEISKLAIFSRKLLFSIKPEQIIEVSLNQETYRSAGKAAAGAIVGGLLTGGIGLIAGAALGGRQKKENHLQLIVSIDGKEYEVFFKPSKELYQFHKALVNHASKTH